VEGIGDSTLSETWDERKVRLEDELTTLISKPLFTDKDAARLKVVQNALAEYKPEISATQIWSVSGPGNTQTQPRIPKTPPSKAKGDRVDAWMRKPFYYTVPRQKLFLILIGMWAFVPFIFMSRAEFDMNGPVLDQAVADVLGTSSALLLFLCLLVTPMRTLTGQTWFTPLRQWFGIMFAASATLDATTASIVTTEFVHGPIGRLFGHSFLLIGAVMVSLAIPLALTANRWSQKKMGKYWKWIQRFTYVIWALLLVHMALLFGFLNKQDSPHDTIFHQRFFQILGLSFFLFLFRIPDIKRWCQAKQKAGEAWKVYLAAVPSLLLMVIIFGFMISEEVFKGVAILSLHPIND
jgi:methionine sulfoxide reductase heme-binding subunit